MRHRELSLDVFARPLSQTESLPYNARIEEYQCT
jgi:hypothetical protein